MRCRGQPSDFPTLWSKRRAVIKQRKMRLRHLSGASRIWLPLFWFPPQEHDSVVMYKYQQFPHTRAQLDSPMAQTTSHNRNSHHEWAIKYKYRATCCSRSISFSLPLWPPWPPKPLPAAQEVGAVPFFPLSHLTYFPLWHPSVPLVSIFSSFCSVRAGIFTARCRVTFCPFFFSERDGSCTAGRVARPSHSPAQSCHESQVGENGKRQRADEERGSIF